MSVRPKITLGVKTTIVPHVWMKRYIKSDIPVTKLSYLVLMILEMNLISMNSMFQIIDELSVHIMSWKEDGAWET